MTSPTTRTSRTRARSTRGAGKLKDAVGDVKDKAESAVDSVTDKLKGK